jgi:hypothetical protein
MIFFLIRFPADYTFSVMRWLDGKYSLFIQDPNTKNALPWYTDSTNALVQTNSAGNNYDLDTYRRLSALGV